MHDATLMRHRERVTDLRDNSDGLVDGQRPILLDVLPQIMAAQQLHHDERLVLVNQAEVENLHHVRCVELCEPPSFLLKACSRGSRASHDLHRHLRAQRHVRGRPHGPHVAAADLVLESQRWRKHRASLKFHGRRHQATIASGFAAPSTPVPESL